MKENIVLIVVVTFALLIAACTQSPTAPNDVKNAPSTANLPPPPPPPGPVRAPHEDDKKKDDSTATVLNDSAELFAGDKSLPVDGGLKNIVCDATKKELSFTIVNQDERIWSLDQEVGFGRSLGTVNLKVFINNEEANSKSPRYADGKRLFGPKEKFSDNCGGVTMLSPGKEARCTLNPVPLKVSSAFENKNQMWLSVPGGNIKYVTFTCD